MTGYLLVLPGLALAELAAITNNVAPVNDGDVKAFKAFKADL